MVLSVFAIIWYVKLKSKLMGSLPANVLPKQIIPPPFYSAVPTEVGGSENADRVVNPASLYPRLYLATAPGDP
jgi:hypothetical protein